MLFRSSNLPATVEEFGNRIYRDGSVMGSYAKGAQEQFLKTNVDKFFEIYDADPALQARVQQAMDSYPGSLEIRDVMTEHVLLPVAEELGLPFTLKELRNYELLKWGRQHQDRELTDDEMAADDETTYWLLDRGWSNDEAAFCGGEH